MTSDEFTEECGYEFDTKDGICENDAKYEDGRCGIHTNEKEGDGPGDKHGLHASEYYKDLPQKDQNFIDVVADDLLEKSYYGTDDKSMVEKCRQIAIDLHQKRRADGYIGRTGMTQENTVGFHEDYGEMTETAENTLFITKDRLSRESRLNMKDLGILDQEENGEGGESSNLIDNLSEDLE